MVCCTWGRVYVTMFFFLCTAGTVLCCVRCRYRGVLLRLQVPCCVGEELWYRGQGGVRWPYALLIGAYFLLLAGILCGFSFLVTGVTPQDTLWRRATLGYWSPPNSQDRNLFQPESLKDSAVPSDTCWGDSSGFAREILWEY